MLVGLLLVGLNAGAVTFTPTFDYTTCSETGYGGWTSECIAEKTTGKMHLQATASGFGEATTIQHLGDSFTTNSGAVIPDTYTATTSVDAYLKARLLCVGAIGDSYAELELRLLRWERPVGTSSWNSAGNVHLEDWDCGFYNVVSENVAYGVAMVYKENHEYRLALKVEAYAKSVVGFDAQVDLCSHPDGRYALCQTGDGDEHVRLDSITIANQAPYLEFPYGDNEWWWPEAFILGADVKARTCDVDGVVKRIKITVDGVSSEKNTNAICTTHTYTWNPPLPGTYDAEAQAWDDEGLSGYKYWPVGATLFPEETQNAPAGYPDLSPYGPTSSARVETKHDLAGAIIGHKVTIDGVVVSETIGPLVVTRTIAEDYDVTNSHVTVKDSGTVIWSGNVTSEGPHWWNVVPAS